MRMKNCTDMFKVHGFHSENEMKDFLFSALKTSASFGQIEIEISELNNQIFLIVPIDQQKMIECADNC